MMLPLVRPCASTADSQPSGTYYQLLDVSPDEQDPKVIEEAALRRSIHVRAYQLTRPSESTQRLNEIAQALITLLDSVRRREYDLGIGKPPMQALDEGVGRSRARSESSSGVSGQPTAYSAPLRARLGQTQPLGACMSPSLPEDPPPDRRDTRVLQRGKSASPGPGEDTLVLRIRAGRTCDVKLVYQRCAL
jgi:hypothetical protein